VWQFSFQSPTKHPPQVLKDVILMSLCYLIFRIIFLEDSSQRLLIYPWSTGVLGPLWRSDLFHRGTIFRHWPLRGLVRGSCSLCMPVLPGCWVPPVPAWLALAFFSFHPALPDSIVLTRWSLPTPEVTCFRTYPSRGLLELLVPCSDVSELLTPRESL
jgi:hypothetical protein